MSSDFKRGFLIALGIMAAIIVVGWVMKLLLWITSSAL